MPPGSFFNSDVKYSPSSLKKDRDSPMWSGWFMFLKKLTPVTNSISGGGLVVYPHWFTSRYRWKAYCRIAPIKLLLKALCPTLQPMFLKLNQWTTRFLNHKCSEWVGNDCGHCRKTRSLSFPYPLLLAIIFRLLVSWRFTDLQISLYVVSGGTGLWASSRVTEGHYIHRFCCSYGLEFCMAATAECKASLICYRRSLGPWAFGCDSN